jgi:flavin reductase (DIM6/NTAB) family NADH-FMN oxidoreductase RutF
VKVPFDIDKHCWHPSVLPGQIVLISTVDERGEPDVAPKSWISMVAFDGPVLLFGCNTQHATFRNALATGCFVVNAPDEPLAPRIWGMLNAHGADRLALAELTLAPAQRVAAPIVNECRAHLECAVLDSRAFEEEVVVFGQVVAASIDPDCLRGPRAGRYSRLRPVFFLEDGYYASLGRVRSVR